LFRGGVGRELRICRFSGVLGRLRIIIFKRVFHKVIVNGFFHFFETYGDFSVFSGGFP
jgi:hypothetical protein